MDLCIVTENDYKGGLDTFIITLVNAWPDPGARLTLLCNESHPGLDTIRARTRRLDAIRTYRRWLGGRLAAGATVRSYLLSRLIRGSATVARALLQYPVLAPWYLMKFLRLFRKSTFSHLLVVNGGYPASLVCRCACVAWRWSGRGATAVLTFHNFYQPASAVERVAERALDRMVAKSCATVVSVSDACLDSIRANPAFRGSHLAVIENGLEDPVRSVDADGCAKELESLPDRYLVMLATLEVRKGHEFLLHAFKRVSERHPDVHLCMFGHGTRRDERRISRLIQELGLAGRATLGGFTLCGPAIIQRSTMLLVPSQAFESFGLTIVEGMALSRPVVATDTGGIPQVLRGTGAGTVVPATDHVAFGDAMLEILDDDALARRMGACGRETFERRFTARRMARAYLDALRQAGS